MGEISAARMTIAGAGECVSFGRGRIALVEVDGLFELLRLAALVFDICAGVDVGWRDLRRAFTTSLTPRLRAECWTTIFISEVMLWC